MKAIKQKDKLSCIACVACMATNTKLVDFERFFFVKGPPFSDSDFYRYLLAHGYVVGIGFNNEEGHIFDNNNRMSIIFHIEDYPAYVIVKSMRFKGMEHVIYWDGNKMFDSNPNIKADGLALERYEILKWFPIIKLHKSGELIKEFPE